MRAIPRGALAALILLLLAAALPTRAAAHLSLVNSVPADADHLETPPQEIRLRFSEAVTLAFTRVELLGPDGSRVRLAEPSVFAVADEPRAVAPMHHDPGVCPEAEGFTAESPGYVIAAEASP